MELIVMVDVEGVELSRGKKRRNFFFRAMRWSSMIFLIACKKHDWSISSWTRGKDVQHLMSSIRNWWEWPILVYDRKKSLRGELVEWEWWLQAFKKRLLLSDCYFPSNSTEKLHLINKRRNDWIILVIFVSSKIVKWSSIN